MEVAEFAHGCLLSESWFRSSLDISGAINKSIIYLEVLVMSQVLKVFRCRARSADPRIARKRKISAPFEPLRQVTPERGARRAVTEAQGLF